MKRVLLSLYLGISVLASFPAWADGVFESVKFEREVRSQLQLPVDVALGENGSTLLLDQKALLVKTYDSTGAFVGQFGGKNLLKQPVALAVGPGTFVVADARLKKVLVFDEQGAVITKFGGSGKLAGQFSKLRDVEVDRFGFIYTADAGNKSVSRFSDRGILLSLARFDSQTPEDIALDVQGNVYVLMANGTDVYKLQFEGASNRRTRLQFKPGLKSAGGLFVDHKGDIYLAQVKKNNVVKYDQAGGLLASFGSRGKGPGAFNKPTRLTGNAEGELYIIDSKNKRAQVFKLGGNDKPNLEVAVQSPPTVAFAGSEIIKKDIITALHWHSADRQLRLFGGSGRLLSKGLQTTVVGKPGKKAGEFRKPQGVAVLPDGRLVVADTGNHRVQILSPGGRAVVFGERGDEPGFFKSPTDVAVNAEGMIYVADSGNARVQIFTDQGIYLHSFGRPGKSKKDQPAPLGDFGFPAALAIDSRDQVHVLDTVNQRIASFSGRGEPLSLIGGFSKPVDIALDTNDNIYVADNNCHCIWVLRAGGEKIMRFGGPGDGLGKLGDISAISVGDKQLFVADASNGQLKTFNLALAGLTLEQRIRLNHSYYVPGDAVGDVTRMGQYRALALENVASELATQAGISAAVVIEKMRVDKEVVMPGGEIRLTVSIPKPESIAPISEPVKPTEPNSAKENEVELAF